MFTVLSWGNKEGVFGLERVFTVLSWSNKEGAFGLERVFTVYYPIHVYVWG